MWYLDRGLQAVDKIPSKIEKYRLDPLAKNTPTAEEVQTVESLAAKVESLTKMLAAMQYQQLQQRKG